MSTKLSIGFRGLCLFTQRGDVVEVSILDCSQATNAADRSALHAHRPELWVIKGSVAPPASRTLMIDDHQIAVVPLGGNQTLQIDGGSTERVVLEDHLPRFPAIDGQVRNVALEPQDVAATFILDRGTLQPGPLTKVKWHGPRRSQDPDIAKIWIPEYMLLELTTDSETVTITRGGPASDLVFTPDAGAVELRIGSEPETEIDTPMVHHFKWFYRHMDFGGEPVLGLAFPEVVERARVKEFGPRVLSGSSFCPDGQYP